VHGDGGEKRDDAVTSEWENGIICISEIYVFVNTRRRPGIENLDP